MIEELIKLIRTFTYTLSLVNQKLEKELEGIAPVIATPPGTQPIAEPPVKKATRGRPKKTEIAPEMADPFPTNNGDNREAEPSAEDYAEAKRKCQQMMGLFIRRYLKATPPGLDRAKAILQEVCGRPISRLEDLTYEDNVKLIPRFERELENAAA